MSSQRSIYFTVLILLLPCSAFAEIKGESNQAILQSFADDYVSDPMLINATFGIQVGDDQFHVIARSENTDGQAQATLSPGFPEKPVWYFKLDDRSILDRLDQGTLNPGTAMAKAFQTDKTPMDIEFQDGFQPGEGFLDEILKVTFHFWNRGFPEVIPFNDEVTRFTHGTDASVFYYQPGFRSGWFSIKKGHHVNKDPNSQTNPFPTMMIFTEGSGIGRIGGKDIPLAKGQAVFIPPNVQHEFFNENEQPFQGVLVMFGEGA